MRFLLLIATIGVLAIVVPQSYADSDFVLTGSGFGKINGKVGATSLQLLLQMPDSGKPVFESGQILLGDNSYSIATASLFLSDNKKLIQLDAKTGDTTVSASGKLALSAGDNSIYHLRGKTISGDTFSIFAKLKPILAISEPTSVPKNDLLLLVKQTERVEWKSQYKFVIRTFDPKANPLSDFYSTSGYLEGMTISASVTNPLGEIIKTSDGMTKQFGYYDDSVIIPDNARTGIYKLTVTASGKDHQSVTKEFTFVVIPNSTPS